MGGGKKPKKAQLSDLDLEDVSLSDLEELSLSDLEDLAGELSDGELEALDKELRKDPEMAKMMDDVEKELKKGGKGGKGKGPKKGGKGPKKGGKGPKKEE